MARFWESVSIPAIISLLIIFYSATTSKAHNYGKGFFNQTGCLYAYTEGGTFEMITVDGDVISEKLQVDEINFDSAKSRCIEDDKQGKIVFSFKLDEKNKLKSVAISMRIARTLAGGYWEISQANLTVMRADVDRKRTFQLDLEDDIYASLQHSYSCSELVLQTLHKRKPDNETGKVEPRAILTLNRFQLQPFPEPQRSVFADSFDCSVFFTLPGVMSLIVILFFIFVVLVGVALLMDLEPNDYKYTRESIIFVNTQLEANKRQ